MEIILLPFGNVTAACVTLLVVYLLATLVVEVVLRLIKFTIAADDENAPEIKLNNVLYSLICKMFIVKNPKDFVKERWDGYVVCDGDTCVSVNNFPRTWSDVTDQRRYCVYKERKQAEDAANRYYYYEKPIKSIKCVFKNIWFLPILADVILYTFGFAPLMTTITVVSVSTVFSVRWIAKKLYKNIKKTNNHEERITTLEGKDDE